MSKIMIGNTAIDKFYYGDQEVDKVYRGTELLYELRKDIPNTWTRGHRAPIALYKNKVVVVENNVYSLGGQTGRVATYDNYCYDTSTNTWVTKTPVPKIANAEGIIHHACASVGDKIFVVGGYHSGYDYSNKTLCYNTKTDTWTTKSPAPIKLFSHTMVSIGTKIYVLGGDTSKFIDSVYCYDTVADTWTTKAPMPNIVKEHSAVAIGDKIYSVGGYRYPEGPVSSVYCYDIKTNIWTTKADMPEPRQNITAATANGKLYAIGGWSTGYADTNFCYDPDTNSWTIKEPVPEPITTAATATDGKVYLIGGVNSKNTAGLDTTYIYSADFFV